MKKRCQWAKGTIAMIHYHDTEWGVPVHDDRRLFEFLILEGAQAGLSWQTILEKRENYRKAFDQFDPRKVARYDGRRIARLLKDPGIVRNRLKVEAAVVNAQKTLEVQKEIGSLTQYLWQFVGGKPIQNRRRSLRDLPPESEVSRELSKDMRRRGFKFVGPTTLYAFMQAVGMVNDHEVTCFRYREVARRPSVREPQP